MMATTLRTTDSVHPELRDARGFPKVLDSAHQRGIRVIIEMVLNHTSDQHPWFQEARSSQDNPRRDWYVWSDTDDRYKDTRIIFLDTEKSNWAWDPDFEVLLLAPLFQPPAGSQLRQSGSIGSTCGM